VTFSICAFDPTTGRFGIGAVTAEPAVGKLVTHARAGSGVVATQAVINPYLGLDGLELLTQGKDGPSVLDAILAGDPGRDVRQVGVVDRAGRATAWTGPSCPDWAGHLERGHVTVQGNRLVGPETLDAAMQAFVEGEGRELARRLLAALQAGEATGADQEGAVSATILVVDTEEYPLWDVRVDHAEDPVAELARLLDVFEEELLPTLTQLSTRIDPMGPLAREQLAS
jgi:uncharacterized Ntn-hydrolase superfamily protein